MMEALLGREPAHGEYSDEATAGSSIEYDEDSTVSEAYELKNALEAHARELTEQLKKEITLHAESVAAMAEVNAPPKKKNYSAPLTSLNISVIQDETTGLVF